MNQPTVLSVEGLRTGYGKMVVADLSFDVGAGESLALLGPNGHGKTTVLRAISGLERKFSGSVRFDGADITHTKPSGIVALGLMHVPQGNTLFPALTVSECLMLGGRTPHARAKRKDTLEFVETLFPKLAERAEQRVGTLSGGERQMVAIGMGMMALPRLLVLDEPTLGLAPRVRLEILETLLTVRQTGLSLIVTDGDVDFLFDVSDRWISIELGQVVGTGSSRERPSHEEVMEMYVGNSSAPSAQGMKKGSPRHA